MEEPSIRGLFAWIHALSGDVVDIAIIRNGTVLFYRLVVRPFVMARSCSYSSVEMVRVEGELVYRPFSRAVRVPDMRCGRDVPSQNAVPRSNTDGGKSRPLGEPNDDDLPQSNKVFGDASAHVNEDEQGHLRSCRMPLFLRGTASCDGD